MTVKELRRELAGLDDDLLVVMSSDSEGNSYSPLSEVISGNSMYIEDSPCDGFVRPEHLTPELEERGFASEDVCPDGDGVRAVVLWPAN